MSEEDKNVEEVEEAVEVEMEVQQQVAGNQVTEVPAPEPYSAGVTPPPQVPSGPMMVGAPRSAQEQPAPPQPNPAQPGLGQPPAPGMPVQPPAPGMPVQPPAPGVPVQPPAPGVPMQAAPLGQAPLQQGYAPQMVAARPNPFVMALQNIWHVTNDVWRGRVAQAFERPQAVVRATGDSVWNWLAPFISVSILSGLSVILITAAGTSFMSFGLPGAYMSFGLPGTYYFLQFLLVSIGMFVLLILQGLAVMWAHQISGARVNFSASLTTIAVAQTIWIFPYGAIILLALLSMVAPQVLIIALLGFGGVALMVELLTYIGLSRQAQHVRSPLVPYVWLTVAMSLAGGLVYFLLAVLLLPSAF